MLSFSLLQSNLVNPAHLVESLVAGLSKMPDYRVKVLLDNMGLGIITYAA